MDRLGFVVGNRENRLGNHAFQDILGQREPGSAGNLSKRREFVRLGRGQIKHRAAAFDGCHQLVVRLDIDDVVRQLADNVEQQPCIVTMLPGSTTSVSVVVRMPIDMS